MINNNSMDNNNIYQNLKDAGCEASLIEEFFELQKTGQKKDLLNLLAIHKSQLIKRLYENQKKIDCLDFLIFSLKEWNKQ